MKCLVVLSALLAVATAIAGIGRTQSVAVKGQLMCNGRPSANTKVKLYDDDRGLDTKIYNLLFECTGVDTDDLMAEGKSDMQGRFELRGHETEITTIDPKLNIYHDCNDELVVLVETQNNDQDMF
jgi:hypothetical protein